MHGVWMEQGRVSYRNDLPRPLCRKQDALIRVTHAGICGTDVELLEGYAAFTGIPGHEFAGLVTACESAPELIGQRVVGSINIRCDACDHRCSGVEHCPDRKAIGIRDAHGAFADCLALPVENLQLVPAHLADTQAVFAEPVAAALRILEQVSIDAGYRVLVIGAGKLGQIIARVMQSTDCDLAVVARYERQLELLELAGIAPITEAGIQPRSYDIAIEATGSPEAVTAAVAAAKPRGTVVLKSTHGEPSKVDLADIVVNEITLIGSRCGPMEKAVALLASGRLDLDPLIDDCLPFSDVSEAFERARQPGAGKILLRP